MDALAQTRATDRPAPETTIRRDATVAGTAPPVATEAARGRRTVAVVVAAAVLLVLVAGGLLWWLVLRDGSAGAGAAGSSGGAAESSGPPHVLRIRPVLLMEPAGPGSGSGTAQTDPNAPAVSLQEAQAQFAALTCGSRAAPADRPQDYVAECSENGANKYVLGPAVVDGTGLVNATARTRETTGEWVVALTFDDATQATWSDYTASHIGEQVAFTLDQRVISTPIIQSASTGDTDITGSFTEESATRLAGQLGG
jgi:preprotein translocase subunit SecD